MFHDDGCIIANIATRPFRIIYRPDCEHTKIRGAQIVISAESETAALAFAQKWLRLPQMTAVLAQEITPNQKETQL